jgi:uncharacterized membrane protein YGL010W
MTKAELFSEYAAYHADSRNRVCHAIGIPLIVLGIMGIVHLVSFGPVNLAELAGIVTLAYYARLDPKGALISAVAFAILYFVAVWLPWQIDAAAFVIGWVFQLVGHRFEGTKPKFLENLVYLLIGPLYFFEEVFDVVLGVHGESHQS